MKSSVANFVSALVVPGLAALGGAAIVFSEFDDAPGGILIGFLFIVGAVVLGLWVARRRDDSQSS